MKGEIVKEYLEHPEWGSLPSLTLARLIYKDNVEVFKDVDDVRGKIRYYRGQRGKAQRHRATHKAEPAEHAKALGVANPFGLPESDEEDWEPFVLPKGNDRILLLSDIHVPYHNIQALTKAIEYGKEKKVNAVVLNCDTFDCYALSRYDKDPRKRGFAAELEACRQLLGILKRELDCPIYFKLGNHEERYEAYLRTKAPELLGTS